MRKKNYAECQSQQYPATIVNNYYSVFSPPIHEHKHYKKCNHVMWNYKVGRQTLKSEESTKMLELSCTNEEKIHVSLKPVTAAGKPVPIENFTVSVQSGDGTFEIDPDGAFGFWVISGDAAGDTAYAINADADLGEGVQNIADFITLRVHGALAAALGMVAEAPVLK
jgi:hypothetical protein